MDLLVLVADICVMVPIRDKTPVFTYLVPDHLKSVVVLGMSVTVPFGPRQADGLVLGLRRELLQPKWKELATVRLDVPPVAPELINLAHWISDYYLCSLADGLHCVLPPGYRGMEHAWLMATSGSDEILDHVNRVHGSESAVGLLAQALQLDSQARLTDFSKRLNRQEFEIAAKLLVDMGVAEWYTERRATTRSRSVAWVQRTATECPDVTTVQRHILDALDNPEGLSVADLLKQVGCSRNPLQTLEKHGMVQIFVKSMARDPYGGRIFSNPTPLQLTTDQQSALSELQQIRNLGKSSCILLHGVTGSGKTEVYLQILQEVLSGGSTGIVLVPEISLTPQTVERFKGRFGASVAVLHSKLSTGERWDEWQRIHRGEVTVIVGARSAVFAPVQKLGIIIIDEEHDGAYKQDENPRYHVREVAIARAQATGATVLLGSATPSLETYHRALEGRYHLVTMPARVNTQPLPDVAIVDMRDELRAGNRHMLSRALQEQTQLALDRGEQAILFLNRRGYSTFVTCRNCGLVMRCPHCEVSLTYHRESAKLICHYCAHEEKEPSQCPKCSSRYIRFFGTGTEKVEEEIRLRFPQARLARMDLDTVGRKGAHEQILSAFRRQETNLLIGTQMIAKGLDFPNVTLVGVITADTSLNLPDFRAAERTFQLLTQVAGRCGRGDLPGKVLIQTYSPEQYAIEAARTHNYEAFARQELIYRQEGGYPPHARLISVLFSGEDETRVSSLAEEVATELRDQEEWVVLGPAPCVLNRLRGQYRYRLTLRTNLKSPPYEDIGAKLRIISARGRGIAIAVDVDPLSML